MPLTDISVNMYNTSELVRLCLRKHEDQDIDPDDEEAEDDVVKSCLCHT